MSSSDTPEIRAYMRAVHRCTRCRKQDAYTLNGRGYCAECAEKYREKGAAFRNQSPEHRARYVGYAKKHQEKLKAAGLCVSCGQRPPKEGRFRCERCLAKRRNYAKNKRIEAGMNYPRGDNGFCYLCNKRPAVNGKRLCPQCMERQVETLNKYAMPLAHAEEQKRKLMRYIFGNRQGRTAPKDSFEWYGGDE